MADLAKQPSISEIAVQPEHTAPECGGAGEPSISEIAVQPELLIGQMFTAGSLAFQKSRSSRNRAREGW